MKLPQFMSSSPIWIIITPNDATSRQKVTHVYSHGKLASVLKKDLEYLFYTDCHANLFSKTTSLHHMLGFQSCKDRMRLNTGLSGKVLTRETEDQYFTLSTLTTLPSSLSHAFFFFNTIQQQLKGQ